MKITCQSCQSKYTVSDEKVQGKTVKIKCRKCGATILVSSGGVSSSSGSVSEVAAAPAGAGDATTYLVNVAEGDQRSMSMTEIVAAYQTSVVTAETYVWADGMSDWSPLGQVDAIVAALNAPPTEAPSEAPFGEPAPASVVAAAAPAGFEPGGFEPAPVAAQPEPAPRAAAKRDNVRRGPDLFGRGSEEHASSGPYATGSTSAARSAPAGNASAREENSMLFSLSALTAKVATSSGPASQPAPRSTSARNNEDSGIIDLKALAAAAASTSNQPPAALATDVLLPGAALFPLGAPSVTAPVAAPIVTPTAEPSKSRTPVFIGAGAIVAVAAIVGAFVFMRGGPPPPTQAANDVNSATTASAAPSATATAAIAGTASAAPTDTVAAVDPGSAAASASASASAKVASKAGPPSKGGGGTSKGGAATPPPATPPPATPPPPKKSACGCAAGDLMCAMKCSAK